MQPWELEPDRKHWIDAATGLDCLIVRNARMKHLCGYVGVPKGHPWHGKSDNDLNPEVHGGLTYAEGCNETVCHHAPEDSVANEDVWWLGFDCAHAGDLSPYMKQYIDLCGYETYKDFPFVEGQCAFLAAQVKQSYTEGKL